MKNIAVLLTLLFGAPVFAASPLIYKYKDSKGNIIYTDNMPANVKSEFSLLSSKSGTIKKVVEKELSAQEVAQKEEKEKAEKAVVEKTEAQKKRDIALLSTYSNVDEIDKMKKYELAQIELGLKNNAETIHVIEQKLAQLDASKKLTPNNKQLMNDYERTQNDLNLAKKTLEDNKALYEQRTQKYAEDRARYLEILGEKGTPKPENINVENQSMNSNTTKNITLPAQPINSTGNQVGSISVMQPKELPPNSLNK